MLRADPAVVSPLQVRVMRAIALAEAEYGSVDLRLEGGTALAGAHTYTDFAHDCWSQGGN